jgi:L-asparaginase / beta-aspartyl-peptidase
MSKPLWKLCLHGGAGALSKDHYSQEQIDESLKALHDFLQHGALLLEQGKSSLDVCREVTKLFEDHPFFNAGTGSVLNEEGNIECDASIMCGKFNWGAGVTGLTSWRHPIDVAFELFKARRHTLIGKAGADQLATKAGLEPRTQQELLTIKRKEQWENWHNSARPSHQLDHGGNTVGVVALDQQGNLASATSTGGMTGKQQSRVSDSSIIGAGTYADNQTVAVSCTGTGDIFILKQSAFHLSVLIESGMSLPAAAAVILSHVEQARGSGGLIALMPTGESVMPYNTGGMFRGEVSSNDQARSAIWDEWH